MSEKKQERSFGLSPEHVTELTAEFEEDENCRTRIGQRCLRFHDRRTAVARRE